MAQQLDGFRRILFDALAGQQQQREAMFADRIALGGREPEPSGGLRFIAWHAESIEMGEAEAVLSCGQFLGGSSGEEP